ncbi:HAD family hydrolase [Paenibacillus woosongensis]|uniref:Haloacid dehalogenase n=1 Tax=Paenibacillus woosongensis TaxID=307580 RepID=A0ABQ4MPF3_9BACL|nr:HAD family hydrolase [Paenibacillus woosongensis]GIP57582.1 haloacid dehalogenase [Paenibacillus woosongensis]
MPELIVSNHSYAINGILLDKDGTLLDFVSMWGSWSEHMLRHFGSQLVAELRQSGRARQLETGLEPGQELLFTESHLWGTVHGLDGAVIDYDRNGPLAMGTMEELFTLLTWRGYRAGLSWAKAKELAELSGRLADAELERARPVRPIAGVLAFLKACHAQHIPLGVVTADDTLAAEKHLEWLGIRHLFGAVVGTDQVGRGKPFPDMLELACGKLSIDVQGAAVIGDTNGDMIMGQAAGARICIGLHSKQAGAAELLPDADYIIGAYEELRLKGAAE